MPREIKFRGRRLDNGEWAIGHYIEIEHNDDKSHKHYAIMPIPLLEYPLTDGPEGVFVEVDPKTVGQFTGEYCKNGKIFEHDVVESQYYRPSVVCFSSGIFMAGDTPLNQNYDGIYPDNEWKKIGNIHDNPELLEVV